MPNPIFALQEIDGIQFSVSKKGEMFERTLFFRVTDDQSQIAVCELNRANEVTYSVGLDANGKCKFKRGSDLLDPWQVLMAALKAKFFD